MPIKIVIPKALLQSLVNNTFAAWQWTDPVESPGEWARRGRTYEAGARLLLRHYPDVELPKLPAVKPVKLEQLFKDRG